MKRRLHCRYRTPNLTDIDHAGLHPDEACNPFGITPNPGSVPITEDALEHIGAQLALDSCIMTAETFLDNQLSIGTVSAEPVRLSKQILVGGEQVQSTNESRSVNS